MMNVRLIGGPANGQLIAVVDGTREIHVAMLAENRARFDYAPRPEDIPPPFKTYCYRPRTSSTPGDASHVVPFYLNGEMS